MNKRKKNRDKFNPGLSVNRPSNNSALKSKEQLLLLCFALCYFIAGAKQAIVKACGEGWGWPTWGGFAQKGYLFQASGTSKGQGFRSFWSVKRPRRADRCILWLRETQSQEKSSDFVTYSYFTVSAFTAGIPFVKRRYKIAVPFLPKVV